MSESSSASETRHPAMLQVRAKLLPPDGEERRKQKQKTLDYIQAVRDAAKRRRPSPAKLPSAGWWPFPTSPPSITFSPRDNPGSSPTARPNIRPPAHEEITALEPAVKPIPETPTFLEPAAKPIPAAPTFQCEHCEREVYPVTRCACGTPRERRAAWKAAEERWYREDREGWFDANAPPRKEFPTPDQIWLEYEAAVEKAAPEVARREARKAQREAERKAAKEAALAPFRFAAAKAATLGAARVGSAEKAATEHALKKVMRAPMMAVVEELERLAYLEREKTRAPARAAAEAQRLAAQGDLEARVRTAAEKAAEAASGLVADGRRVLSPAGAGFLYLEEGGEVWLAPIDGGATGSVIYVGDADSCVVPGPGRMVDKGLE